MNRLLASRTYTLEDQRAFAELSGDFNPLHLDDVYARREFFGQVVVHGVHALLHALDAFAAERRQPLRLEELHVRFLEPLYLNETAETRLTQLDEANGQLEVRLQLVAAGVALQDIRLLLRSDETIEMPVVARPPYQWPTQPLAAGFAQLSQAAGSIPLLADAGAMRMHAPHLVKCIGLRVPALLSAFTRLVGMECPGLRSVFAGLSLQRTETSVAAPSGDLHWQVTLADERFSKLRMQVETAAFAGTLETFHRPLPVPQPTFVEVAERVAKNEFTGQRALIIGGSRGLGEVTAKIIAAGGGVPTITYHRGRHDAERVAAELRAAGKPCEIRHYDVHGTRHELPRPTDLFYFATPKIFVRRRNGYDRALFERFATCYVEGFRRTVAACRATGNGPLSIFYPSSVAVDDRRPEHAEYADAKLAGERMCEHAMKAYPALSILVRRLPRIATDQTSTYVPYPAADALDVMLDVVHRMSRRNSAHLQVA